MSRKLKSLGLFAAFLLFTLAQFSPLGLYAQAPRVANSVQPFVDKQELAGAVMLVADKEKILAVETVGFEDIAAKKPMRADSIFWIASQSKPITAAVVMILVD